MILMLMRDPMCSSSQPRTTSTVVCDANSASCADQQQIDEAQVLEADAVIDHRLGQEWQDELDRAADQQAKKQLHEQ